MSAIRLVHDVLDAQLIDRHKQKIGRVDALTIEQRDGRPPRVATIFIGGPVRARRIGRWAIWLSHALRKLGRVQRPGVDRIPFRMMRCVGDTIELDVDADDLESQRVEDWLADQVIRRIPGSSGKEDE